MLKKLALLAVLLTIAFGIMMLTTRKSVLQVAVSREIAAPPARIAEILADVAAWPSWWPGLERAALFPAWQPGAALELAFRRDAAGTPARIGTVDPESELGWERPGVLGSRGLTSLRWRPSGEGTEVTMVTGIRGPQAFLARFTGKEAFHRYQQAVLDSLAVRAEASPPGTGGGESD